MRYPRLLHRVLCRARPCCIAGGYRARRPYRRPIGESRPTPAPCSDLDHAALGADPGPSERAVEVLADATHLDSEDAGELLDAVAATDVVAFVDAGQRTGVLAIPEVNQLIAEVLRPPQSIEVSAETADLPRTIERGR